jgi:hypothetical protein
MTLPVVVSTILVTATGGWCTPLVANVPYAEAISSGFTTPVPSATEFTSGKGMLMPMSSAVETTADAPISRMSCA